MPLLHSAVVSGLTLTIIFYEGSSPRSGIHHFCVMSLPTRDADPQSFPGKEGYGIV